MNTNKCSMYDLKTGFSHAECRFLNMCRLTDIVDSSQSQFEKWIYSDFRIEVKVVFRYGIFLSSEK